MASKKITAQQSEVLVWLAHADSRRYIVKNGRAYAVDTKAPGVITTQLLLEMASCGLLEKTESDDGSIWFEMA